MSLLKLYSPPHFLENCYLEQLKKSFIARHLQ
jgi:hypothetical protein